MKRKAGKLATAMLAVWIAGLALVCRPASAHHGNTAYDMEKTVPMKATITKFDYVNPHVQIYFDVTDENGNVAHWSAESHNPAMLSRSGWNRNTLKPGDQVTLIVNPNKVGAR